MESRRFQSTIRFQLFSVCIVNRAHKHTLTVPPTSPPVTMPRFPPPFLTCFVDPAPKAENIYDDEEEETAAVADADLE